MKRVTHLSLCNRKRPQKGRERIRDSEVPGLVFWVPATTPIYATLYLKRNGKVIYKNDAEACKQQLSPEARLLFHQAHSGPIMRAVPPNDCCTPSIRPVCPSGARCETMEVVAGKSSAVPIGTKMAAIASCR